MCFIIFFLFLVEWSEITLGAYHIKSLISFAFSFVILEMSLGIGCPDKILNRKFTDFNFIYAVCCIP